MVINKIKNKVIKPLIYGTAKENDIESFSNQPVELSQAELEKIRTAVLAEIKEKPATKEKISTILTKKFFKKSILTKPVNFNIFALQLNFKRWCWLFLKSLIFGAIFLFLLTVIGIYFTGWQGRLTYLIVRYLPLPAVYLDGEFIALNDFYTDVKAMENYLKRNQLQVNLREIRNRVMKSLIEKKVVEQLAKKNNLTATAAEIDQKIAQSLAPDTSSEQLNQLVTELYGWDFKMYIDKVIVPLIYLQKVEQLFNEQSGNLAIRQRLAAEAEKLQAQPQQFAEIASAVSDDQTKTVGGELGWFSLGELVPELEVVILNLEEKQISQVVETDNGYYLFKLNEKIINDDSKLPYFHLSQIYLKKGSFKKFLDEQIKKTRVLTLIKI